MAGKRTDKLLINICLAASAVVFIVSLGALSNTLYKSHTETTLFDRLACMYEGSDSMPSAESPYGNKIIGIGSEGSAAGNYDDNDKFRSEYSDQTGSSDTSSYELRRDEHFQTIESMNSDFCLWLSVPDTDINYPVVQNKDNPEYYLHRDFYKQKSYAGTPFLGANCEPDSEVIIIYSHNMKDGSMFGGLDRYKDKQYWSEHGELKLGTEYGEKTYKIFGAFETSINNGEFIYPGLTGDLDEEKYDRLVTDIISRTQYETGVIPEYGERIVMLSTCSYHTKGGRYIVAAVRTD